MTSQAYIYEHIVHHIYAAVQVKRFFTYNTAAHQGRTLERSTQRATVPVDSFLQFFLIFFCWEGVFLVFKFLIGALLYSICTYEYKYHTSS